MIKKTITYTDYNGIERTEDHYFNLSKAEITEMNLSTAGGIKQMLDDAVAARDLPKLSAIFKDLILRSYGIKSADGKRFIKSKEISTEFSQTEAYSVLYMELLSDDTAAAAVAFINGILPSGMSAKNIEPQIEPKAEVV